MAWGAVAGAAISVVGGYLTSKHSKSGGGGGGGGAYDPYAPYRGQAAKQLNDLMQNPSDISQQPEYKSRMQAAARTMAAQGYTGSGNALVAAANAGGQAYQQAFSNLSTLSGAGANPAYAQASANQQANYQQQANNQMWGQIGGLTGKVINHYQGSGNMPPIDTGSINTNQSFDTSYTIPQQTYNPPPMQPVSTSF